MVAGITACIVRSAAKDMSKLLRLKSREVGEARICPQSDETPWWCRKNSETGLKPPVFVAAVLDSLSTLRVLRRLLPLSLVSSRREQLRTGTTVILRAKGSKILKRSGSVAAML
jgi:hypothetical protein